MRTMEPTEVPTLTVEAERIVQPCPSCGRDVERTIPAGTLRSIADLARRMTVTCTKCADREDAEVEAAKLRKEREGRVERSELPVMLRGLTFDSYDTSRKGARVALEASRKWAAGEGEKRGLMLVGPVGVGKTRLAASALWAALDRVGVRYVNVAELIVKLSAGFGDRDRAEALKVLTGRGAIVLDDLDKVNPSMTVLAHLLTAIDGRVQAGAPLIVTTNLSPKELVRKFSAPGRNEDEAERRVAAEAIVSRLVGHCTVIRIEGEDGRR